MESHYLILPLLCLLFLCFMDHYSMWFVFSFGWLYFGHCKVPFEMLALYYILILSVFAFGFLFLYFFVDSKE